MGVGENPPFGTTILATPEFWKDHIQNIADITVSRKDMGANILEWKFHEEDVCLFYYIALFPWLRTVLGT